MKQCPQRIRNNEEVEIKAQKKDGRGVQSSRSNIQIIGISERENKENGEEKMII